MPRITPYTPAVYQANHWVSHKANPEESSVAKKIDWYYFRKG